jgi:hypothetical protein
MSKTTITPASEKINLPRPQSKLSSALLAATEQLPKQLHPRRNQHSWFFLRIVLGLFGAALVILPLALPQSWIAAIFGLGFFLTAILLPSELSSHAATENAEELLSPETANDDSSAKAQEKPKTRAAGA